MSESVILCEGYHDRAFWKGWLAHMGCTDLGAESEAAGQRVAVRDPWDKMVTGGEYGFHSKSDRFVRLAPCRGEGNVLKTARRRLRERPARHLFRLVINVDPDTSAEGTDPATGLRREDVLRLVREFDASARDGGGSEIVMDDGDTRVSLVRWQADDESTAGVPQKQTLERLVSAALVAAYPERGEAVRNWLQSRPTPPDGSPKDYAWSHMAGWYAESGCERFYSRLWEDLAVVAQLEQRLGESDAWRVAEALAE